MLEPYEGYRPMDDEATDQPYRADMDVPLYPSGGDTDTRQLLSDLLDWCTSHCRFETFEEMREFVSQWEDYAH